MPMGNQDRQFPIQRMPFPRSAPIVECELPCQSKASSPLKRMRQCQAMTGMVKAFGRRPSERLERSRRAGIRNPSPDRTLEGMSVLSTMVISNDHMEATMGGCRIVSASEFKAKCLDILDRIHNRELERVVITKRGVAVALLLPPEAQAAQVERLHGFLRGSVVIPPTVDLTAPIGDEPFAADQDEIHR